VVGHNREINLTAKFSRSTLFCEMHPWEGKHLSRYIYAYKYYNLWPHRSCTQHLPATGCDQHFQEQWPPV